MRETDDDQNRPDEPARREKPGLVPLMRFGLTFVSGFIVAGLLFWIFVPKQPDSAAPAAVPLVPAAPVESEAREVDADALAAFLAAAAGKDFSAMRDAGEKEFEKGKLIRDSKRLFADYETSSFPPNTTYSFYSEHRDGMVYRILMTVGDDDAIVAFLAEEMKIVQ